jgi:hypothetical protein
MNASLSLSLSLSLNRHQQQIIEYLVEENQVLEGLD